MPNANLPPFLTAPSQSGVRDFLTMLPPLYSYLRLFRDRNLFWVTKWGPVRKGQILDSKVNYQNMLIYDQEREKARQGLRPWPDYPSDVYQDATYVLNAHGVYIWENSVKKLKAGDLKLIGKTTFVGHFPIQHNADLILDPACILDDHQRESLEEFMDLVDAMNANEGLDWVQRLEKWA